MSKRPHNLLALILGGLHLAFCVVFFAIYFRSHDSERSMAFSLFVPFDPWIVPLSKGPDFGEAGFAAVLTFCGTAQWWAIGWLIGKASSRIFKKAPNRVAGGN